MTFQPVTRRRDGDRRRTEAGRRVIEGGIDVGFQTPSSAYGTDFAFGIEGIERIELKRE